MQESMYLAQLCFLAERASKRQVVEVKAIAFHLLKFPLLLRPALFPQTLLRYPQVAAV
jgi:hypothetical protein